MALILAAVLHFIPDSDNPDRILQTLRAPLAPGSYLAISHFCPETDPGKVGVGAAAYSSKVREQAVFRTRDEIARLFKGFDLIEPGLAWLPEWRPDSPSDVPENPSSFWGFAGVGKYTG